MADFKGQIIQVARGDLRARLKLRPLAKGELFVHIVDGSQEVDPAQEIKDLVTNTRIHVLFEGDLFAGAGNSTEVYAIGSGGALKWSGILFVNDYATALQKAKAKPNHIFLYNGNSTLYKDTDPNTELNKSYVASTSTEFKNEINPGDLIFYSPALDQIVVIHTSRSSDALTKINTAALISNSMKNLLTEDPATLKTFLDGPARHYQYFTEENGWEAAQILEACTVEPETVNGKKTGKKIITPGKIGPSTKDGDGVIHYVPFGTTDVGLKKYLPTGFADLDPTKELLEGDFILSLPKADGTVQHKVLSLYGAILQKLNVSLFPGIGKNPGGGSQNPKITRADDYATAIWAEGIGSGSNKYKGDVDFLGDAQEIGEFIDRLFRTKVDIDPTTHKIISSQLPDFLLGAPKYLGHFDATTESWTALGADTTAEDFAKAIIRASHHGSLTNWDNLDASEDDDPSSPNYVPDLSKKVNDALKAGSYWIYQGDTVNISKFDKIFLLLRPDDYDPSDPNNKDNATHTLSAGDWIIYNGEKKLFEVIDNTSSFIGILVNGTTKVAGVAKFLNPTRAEATYENTWKDGQKTELKLKKEETRFEATANSITFTNPAAVLFDSASSSQNFLPVITADGYTFNSRFELVKDQTGFKVTVADTKIGEDLVESAIKDTTLLFANPKGLTEQAFKFVNKIHTPNEDVFTNIEDTGETETVGSQNLHKFIFTFQKFHFQSGWNSTTESERKSTNYSFAIKREANPTLHLPQMSGTLVTEEYVHQGFTVLKAAINDAYTLAVDKLKILGHQDWLQAVRKPGTLDSNGNPTIEYYDSRIKQIRSTDDEFYKVDLYIDKKSINDSTYDELKETENEHRALSVFKDLKKAALNPNLASTVDLELSGVKYNPSVPKTGEQVENVLPNQSGVLLNNNSVIDGGEWS